MKLVIAWILTVVAILLALGGLFAFEPIYKDTNLIRLGVAAFVVLGGGLLYVMARGNFQDWARLSLAGTALVVSLILFALALFWSAAVTL
jgi:hypothetical protein